jgi:hypothetical protein
MSKWSDSGKEWEQPETGNQIARCIRVIELGTQKKEYQGQTSWKRQTLIVWELPDNLMTDGEHAGKPFTISQFYTASLGEKANLRRDLEGWRGKAFTIEELNGFDQKRIIGQPCMLNLIDREGKVRVNGVSSVPKGFTVPPQINESLFYDIDEHDENVWGKLSDGIKKLIEQSKEWQERNAPPKAMAATASTSQASHEREGFGGGDESVPF